MPQYHPQRLLSVQWRQWEIAFRKLERINQDGIVAYFSISRHSSVTGYDEEHSSPKLGSISRPNSIRGTRTNVNPLFPDDKTQNYMTTWLALMYRIRFPGRRTTVLTFLVFSLDHNRYLHPLSKFKQQCAVYGVDKVLNSKRTYQSPKRKPTVYSSNKKLLHVKGRTMVR
jgi:hypothetical protein